MSATTCEKKKNLVKPVAAPANIELWGCGDERNKRQLKKFLFFFADPGPGHVGRFEVSILPNEPEVRAENRTVNEAFGPDRCVHITQADSGECVLP